MARPNVFCVTVILVLVLGGCGLSDALPPEDPTRQASAPVGRTFQFEIDNLCRDLRDKAQALETADSRAEFDRLSGQLLEEQERFVEEASRLSPPNEVEEAFSDYLDATRELVALNQRSNAAQDDSQQLKLELEAAREGISLFHAKEAARLPSACPPPSGAEVYGFLFQTRANVACSNLGAELDQLGRLQAEADTPKGTASLLKFMRALATAQVSAIESAIPPQIHDADVSRMVDLYQQRLEALDRMGDAFIKRDEAAFDEAAQDQQRFAAEADRLAESFGLTECVNFIGVGST